MQEVAAYLLLKIAGKDASAAEITSVLEAGGASADADSIANLLADLEGKDVNEILKDGAEKLKDAAAEEVVEEKEEEKEEEMDLGGGMDMFGGDEAGDGNY
eukprot:CAMPEP_0195512016 /NCGR_PEP_ID=MMETSP0794_2-20130614/4133_1 /TAXON_ID=515487 /ORGANISM="Stephanopyxis turris, Strain CCMP 815" /LENGTH=100 /DNA_ID=CAMNT_0040639731 /DNA_START=120 /DNA_END=422 /DNA_ORIENTATION=+